MNKQEVFDTTINHLYTQQERSTKSGTGCAYRGEGGKTCAVGYHIPDSMYIPEMDSMYEALKIDRDIDGLSAKDICKHFPNHVPSYFFEMQDLLTDLQVFHDNTENGFSVTDTYQLRKLNVIAEDHGLEFDMHAFIERFSK